MKTIVSLMLVLISFWPVVGKSQTGPANGSVITLKGEEITALLKFSKGKLISLSSPDQPREYKPAEVKSFTIDSFRYISYSNDFYKEIVSGSKAVLYQKISDNSEEKIFNGSDIVGFLKTTDGRAGDYYLLLAGETKLDLVTRKTFKSYFTKLFATNDSMISKISNGSLNYDQIKEAVDFYNTD